MRVYKNGEYNGVCYKWNAAYSSEQGPVCTQEPQVFREIDLVGQHKQIIEVHGKQRRNESIENAKLEVVFFEDHNFHAFSSLSFKT